jgi:iron complex outermembrane receptor protein
LPVARGSWWGGEAQVTKSFLDKYKFVIGMEYRDNLQQDQGNFNEKPREIFLDDKRVSAIWALYGQGDLALFSKLRLVVGLRYDSYSNFGGSLSPRGGLIFTPFKSTTLKLLYGKAFRAPNAYELYYQDGNVTTKANADLRPETIQTYEAVWEQFLGRHWFLTTSGYYYRIRDLIGQRTDPADGLIVFNNLDRIEAGGVETALSGKWPGGLETRLSYSFQKAVNSKTGQILSNCPKHLGKVNLNIPLLKDKVFAGVEVHYLAKRLTLDRSQVGDAVIANLTLFSKNLIKNLEVSASVYNLLNQRYRDPGAEEHLMVGLSTLRQDGISFRLKLNYLY